MSIRLLREALMDVPGAHELTMSYEDGGRVQVFALAGRSIRLPAAAQIEEIEAVIRQSVKDGA